MQSETKQCQNCKNNFSIDPDDFSFYDKIKVPPPTWCPDCRQQRRYAWRNERTLYRRNCDATGKSIVSMYSPDSPFKVYSVQTWWGDGWDPKDYAQNIDFNKSFFDQFKELQTKVPRIALLNKNCVDSDYCNHSNDSKNCYLCCTAFMCENVLHSTNVIPLKNSSDCYKVYGKSNENLYECIDIHNCYNCQFCYRVDDSFDCYYSFDLRGCSNCFLSYNLRNQSYYFLNQKYTKEEYFEKVKEFNLSSNKVRKELYEQWQTIIFEKAYHRSMVIEASINSTGGMVFNSKNAINSFDAEQVEDSKYIYFTVSGLKDSYDVYHVGVNCERMYECHAIVRSSNIIGSHLSYDNTNISYCDSCHNSNELFGCVGIKKGSYMIFNKQYTKEEYFELKEKLIEHMRKTGEYGEFFPPWLSPFAYNESIASVYAPRTKEQAIAEGFRWKDNMPGTFGKETIKSGNIPDNINDVTLDITKEVFACERTGRNFNLVSQEFEFYKQHNIPISHLHPDERYKDRVGMRPERRLYDCICAISGVFLKTAYPPNKRPKMIVSDEVYKQEVL